MRSPLFSALILVLIIPAVWFWLWPHWQNISVSRGLVSQLKQEVAAERAANERLLRLAAQIEERQDKVEAIEQSVSKERDDATLIAVFEEAASVNGLVLEQIVIQNTQNASPVSQEIATSGYFDSFSSTITLAGTYSSFDSFLSDVEHSFPFMDIGQINFVSADSNELSADPTFTFEVQLTSYYLK